MVERVRVAAAPALVGLVSSLGLNATQTTLPVVARLTGAMVIR
jgi:hypothetical protein